MDLYIICDSLIAEKGAFSRHTAVCCGNEPCVDKTDTRRCELAHDRMVTGLDTYGECRDNRWAAKRHSDLSE